RNVALKQTLEQSSTYSGTSVITNAASNSVDGNRDSNFGHGSCATAGDHHDRHTSWTLTLDTAKIVNRIIIYNR
ncbi:cell death abnormality protein 1, partial [Biomphalaria pfeifferi]